MSINTMGYNTSIALGALFGGWFADSLGLDSALWFGVALTGAALLVTVAIRRTATVPASEDELATTG
ncbi:hypothetical protein [Dactylosporangium sp. NPDC050588]|uniref:hypothetical protein n=1 Tax=Dactylosporangium sp. NPDC050588 TaxID=3157211 RepID=UPI0033C9AC71